MEQIPPIKMAILGMVYYCFTHIVDDNSTKYKKKGG